MKVNVQDVNPDEIVVAKENVIIKNRIFFLLLILRNDQEPLG
jgi:hypothetical protein